MAPRTFDPDRIAHYEVAGWRAYYDRRWFRLLSLTLSLCQEQFGIPFPRSLAAAYYIVRASIAWVPVEHDLARVVAHLTGFYALAARYAPLVFDPAEAAHAEVVYWDVNRRLSGERDNPALLAALVRCTARFSASRRRSRRIGAVAASRPDRARPDHRRARRRYRRQLGRHRGGVARCYGAVGRQLTAKQQADRGGATAA